RRFRRTTAPVRDERPVCRSRSNARAGASPMTHPILTKAARAVGDCIRQERPLGVPATNTDIARAVFLAGREPDEGMVEAAKEADPGLFEGEARCVWQSMIDHLLNTKD